MPTANASRRDEPFLSGINSEASPGTTVRTPTSTRGVGHTPIDLETLSRAGWRPELVALALAASYLALGTVCFHFVLSLTWMSAFYFSVTTALTVGFGDIDAWTAMSQNSTNANDGRPYSPNDGAIFLTMVYILGGMVVVGASLGLVSSSLLDDSPKTTFRSRHPLLISAILCLVLLLVGALTSSHLEGYDLLHGLYWSVVAMSTVGYGSGTPKSEGGRLFAAVFMLLGVSCMGNLVGTLSARPLVARRQRLEEKVLQQYGATLEADELSELSNSEHFHTLGLRVQPGGGIPRDAFCLLMLVRTGKLELADLQRCQAAFDSLDADGSGTLDLEDVASAQARAE